MKIVLLLLCFVLMAGCYRNSTPMTNEEVIEQKNLCLKNNMSYTIYINGLTNDIVKVNCTGELK